MLLGVDPRIHGADRSQAAARTVPPLRCSSCFAPTATCALVFCAQVISFLGDWFVFVALAGYVDDVTDSELLVSLVLVSFALPSFLASPLAGPIVDRVDRRRLLVVVSALQALAASGLLLLAEDRVWVAFVFQGAVAALAAFVKPAIDAAVPNLARHARRAAHRQRPVRLDVGRDARRRRRARRPVQPGLRAPRGDRRRRASRSWSPPCSSASSAGHCSSTLVDDRLDTVCVRSPTWARPSPSPAATG